MTRSPALRSLAPLAVVLLLACSSSSSGNTGGDCSGASKCPNDGPIPDFVVQICQAQLADAKCGQAYGPLLKCSRANQKCGADGKSTNSVPPECKAESDAYSACAAPPKDGG